MQAAKRARAGYSDELAVIAQRAQAFTNASGTAIALSQGTADEIICCARAGSSAPEVGAALRIEGTFTGLCIQSGTELCCDDAETDTRVDTEAARALGIRSIVVVPIKEDGRVAGVLAVFAATAHAFRITHVAVLKTLAEHIAAYRQRKQRDEAFSLEPLAAPSLAASPLKAAAAAAATSPALPPAGPIKPPAVAGVPRQFPTVAKARSLVASTLTREIDKTPVSKKKKTSTQEERKESNTDFRPGFRTLDAVAALGKRRGAGILLIGAAAVVVIAVAAGLSLKLRRPAAPGPQPALEASTSPATPAGPAPASVDVQPSAKKTSPDTPATHEEIQREREETIVLSARPSRISRARENSIPASDAQAISLGSIPASGSLSNLASAVSQLHPRVLTQSRFEPIAVIKKVQPVYPLVAKQRRFSGSVVVQGTVDKNGRISNLQLISGSPLFRDAAFEAVKQWVFKPARLNGQAIEQSTKIRLDFGAQ